MNVCIAGNMQHFPLRDGLLIVIVAGEFHLRQIVLGNQFFSLQWIIFVHDTYDIIVVERVKLQ